MYSSRIVPLPGQDILIGTVLVKLCSTLIAILALMVIPGVSRGADNQALNPAVNLTQAEKNWLAQHPTIRVGGPMAFPPFHFYDDKGKVGGICPDYAKLIMEPLGLKVEYAKAMPWPQVLEKTKSGDLDLIACAAKSDDRIAFLSFSDPYLSYPLVIITQKDAPFVGGLNDLHGRKIAFIKKVSTYEWLKRDGIVFEPRFVNQPLDALKLVSMGGAFAFIDNLASASYLIQRHGLLNLKIAAPTDWGSYQLFFAARKDWPQLTSIINKVLVSLDKTQLSGIHNKWIAVRYEHGLSSMDIVKWTALVMLPALALMLFFFFANRRLRHEVRQREKAQNELALTVGKLKEALADVKRLSGLLPICASCKKIRDDQGYWQLLEEYIAEHSEAQFSHSLCPECTQKLYPGVLKTPRAKPEADK